MTASSLFPLGHPAFVSHGLDRAAHLRNDDDHLFRLESKPSTRAYVVHRDGLVLKQEAGGPRAQLTIDEAIALGANPGTVFLGLRDDGAALFGMGMAPAAAEKLAGRADALLTDLRGLVMQGVIPPQELAAIATAKSLVGWNQRHGYCANCGTRTTMAQGGWRRDCPSCKTEHFPRTDPVVIMLVTRGEGLGNQCLLGRQKHFPPGMWSCLAGFVEAAETIEDAVRREIFEESGVRCDDIRYYMSQPWPYPSSLMIGCTAKASTEQLTIDHSELEDARWFARDEALLLLRRQHPDQLSGPHPFAIAHHLLRRWLEPEAAHD